MNPQNELLSQLRDIHTVPELPWWPPAPGWWILAVLLLVVLAWTLRKLQLRLRARQRRKLLLGFIAQVEQQVDPQASPQEYLSGLNRVFKIVAIQAFPECACAHMKGSEWTDFLKEKMEPTALHDKLEILADGPYQPFAAFDAASLASAARKWVQKYG